MTGPTLDVTEQDTAGPEDVVARIRREAWEYRHAGTRYLADDGSWTDARGEAADAPDHVTGAGFVERRAADLRRWGSMSAIGDAPEPAVKLSENIQIVTCCVVVCAGCGGVQMDPDGDFPVHYGSPAGAEAAVVEHYGWSRRASDGLLLCECCTCGVTGHVPTTIRGGWSMPSGWSHRFCDRCGYYLPTETTETAQPTGVTS